jgi:phosphoglycolate phosphatase
MVSGALSPRADDGAAVMTDPRPPIAVFDLDGTLADTAGDIIATLNVILEGEGVAPLPFHRAKDLIGAGSRVLIERGFSAQGRPIDGDRLDRLFRAFLDHYEANILNHSALFEGVVEALDDLAADGFRLAVCTNKMERHSVKLLDLMGVAGRFATIAGRDTFPHFKPDARHLTMTIEAAGGDPARAVMVGDSFTDIETARRAGVPSIGVPFGYTDVPMDRLGPTQLVTHWREMPAAVRALAGG